MLSNFLKCLAFAAAVIGSVTAAPLELVAVDRSETSITISWHYDQSKYGVPKHYELAVDDTDLEFLPTTEKVYVLRSISPCHSYNLTLSAVFSTTTLVSDSKTISTLSKAPEQVKNLRTANGDLYWDAPSNSECVKSYKVCSQAMAPHAKPVCKSMPKAPLSLSNFEGCSSVVFQVSGESEDKKSGNPVWLPVETPFKEPENPTSLKIGSVDSTTAQLDWDIARHYSCVQSIVISYGPKSQPNKKKTIAINNSLVQKHQKVKIYNLTSSCSGNEFTISHTSTKGTHAKPIKGSTASNEIKPEAVKGLAALPILEGGSVKITWSPFTQIDCIGRVNVCLINDLSKNKTCKDQKDPLSSSSVTFNYVNACEKYTIVAKAFSSHSKFEGPTSSIKFDSPEEAPGPVSNLRISSKHDTSLQVEYDPPKTNPRCIAGYAVFSMEVVDALGANTTMQVASDSHTVTNLKHCTEYKISVAAVSTSQKVGPMQSVLGRTSGDPMPVTDLKKVSASRYTIVISWSTAGNCASEYWVRYSRRHHDHHYKKFEPTEGDTVVAKFDYLRHCSRYYFEVYAKGNDRHSYRRYIEVQTECHWGQLED